MHTKIHHMLDSMKRGQIAMITPRSQMENLNIVNDQLKVMDKLSSALIEKPLFLFDVDLHEQMTTDDIVSSLSAMQEAGCLTLPFPEMIVESNEFENGVPVRHISLIQEHGETFRVMTWIYNDATRTTIMPPCGIDAQLNLTDKMVDFDVRDTPWMPTFWKLHRDKLKEIIKQTHLIYAGRHITAALILLNTKGMAKRVVPVEPKLNKRRAKNGKTPIPAYTYINIGTVYDRSGNAIDRTTEAGKRASPRVHLRRAHNRNVRVGKGRTGFRLMHFPAVLVNFDPRTGEAPQQKRYKVKGVSHHESTVLDGNVSADPVVTAGVGGGQLQGTDGVL